jgi:hypothetical protein
MKAGWAGKHERDLAGSHGVQVGGSNAEPTIAVAKHERAALAAATVTIRIARATSHHGRACDANDIYELRNKLPFRSPRRTGRAWLRRASWACQRRGPCTPGARDSGELDGRVKPPGVTGQA